MPNYLSPGVYVEETETGSRPIEGVGTAVAAFVGLAAAGPANTPTLVTNWSQYTRTFGGFVPGAEGTYLAHAVYGFFANGGGRCYVVNIAGDGAAQGNGELAAPAQATATAELGPYTVRAVDPGPAGGDISVEVLDVEGGDGQADDTKKLVIKQAGRTVEEYDGVTLKKGRQNVATVVNAQSKVVQIEERTTGASTPAKLAKGSVRLSVGAGEGTEPVPSGLDADDFSGDAAERTGMGGLEAIDEVTMVCAPDVLAAYQREAIDLDTVRAIQTAMIGHCELMGDRIAILDPPPGLNAQQIMEWRNTANYSSPYATMYWPWIKVFDPLTGKNVPVPPSGHMAGIWSRNDDTRGVHKAPANEVVQGAVDLELNITRAEHDGINPLGINCLRAFPGRGIRVWGARTLAPSDSQWRYLNVRRLFNYLEESILSGTQWVVFEPNDQALWAKIRRTISAFLVMEWRKGALFGLTPAEAFYVKCDDETNPAEAIDAGQVLCEIGVAPVKPAEFVIFRLSQFSGGTSLVAE